MKIRALHWFIILFFLLTFLVFFKGLKNTNIYTPKFQNEKNIPLFKANIFDNNVVVNSDDIFEEKNFYIMNIWASWCLPCREEHTFLMNLKTLNKIKVFGINYKDDLGNAKKFLKELGNPYDLILADKNGTISIEWGAYGVPETFLIYDKKIIKRFIGPINSNSLLEINNLLK